jgi:DNA topoisomerase-1
VVDYEFTAKMENNLDEIANGKKDWMPVVAEFYGPFEKKLTAVARVAERVAVPTEVTGEKCPLCKDGEQVIRIGRFGKFISCSKFPECKYTAPFVPKLEGVVCPKCGGQIVIKTTKEKHRRFYGCVNYPKCNWASWHKPKA